MYLAVSLFFLLLIVALWLIGRSAKLAVVHRVLHIRMVLVTILFAVLSTVFYARILELIDLVLSIPIVQNVLFYIMPTSNVAAAFFWIITLLSCLFLSLAFCILAVILYHLWLKQIAKKGYLNSRFFLTKLLNKLSSLFYKMDEGSAELKIVWCNIGHWLRYMRNIFGILLLIEAVLLPVYLNFSFVVIEDILLAKIVKSLYLIPVISFFILDQMVIMLQADVHDDDIALETEENRLTHLGDYKKLIPVYEGSYGGDALIATYVNDQAIDENLFSGPDEAQLKRAASPELLSAICRNVNNVIHPLSTSYVNALVDLVNGRSVAVFDSYRGDFAYYYLAFVQQNLLLRRKALVICDTDIQVNGIIGQYCDIFNKMNKVHPIWRICGVDSAPFDKTEVDILVCTEEQICAPDFFETHKDFIDCLHDVMVLHAYEVMCRPDPFMLRFFRVLSKKQVQYAFFLPENSADMKNSLKYLLGGQSVELFSNFNASAGACILCWRQESYYKYLTDKALDMKILFNDFGIAYAISIIAMKFNVANINIHAALNVPLESYKATVKQYAVDLSEKWFVKDNVSLDSVVEHNPLFAFHEKELSFDIFYDEHNNLLNVAQLALSTSAEVSSMIHIISRPYMLRDFFADNISILCQNFHGIQHLVPTYVVGITAPAVVLLTKLWGSGMSCEQIVSFMHSFDIKEQNVEKLLTMALNAVFGEGVYPYVYQYFSFGTKEIAEFKNDDYHYTRNVTLTSENIYRKACEMTVDNARTGGVHSEILPINRNSVYNYYLPGQNHSFGGVRYNILAIKNAEIILQNQETMEREETYSSIYEIRDVVLGDTALFSSAVGAIGIDLFDISLTRTIDSYFIHFNGLDFCLEGNTIEHRLSNPIVETREANCLRIRIQYTFGKEFHRCAALFLVLFRGLLETVLPRNYQDILVLSGIDIDSFDAELFEREPDGFLSDPIPSDWLESEDYVVPLKRDILKMFQNLQNTALYSNSEDNIDLYLVDFSGTENAALDSVRKDISRLFAILNDYVSWVIRHQKLKHQYLKFGYNQIPDIFDLVTVNTCLNMLASSILNPKKTLTGKTIVFDPTETTDRCSFCGRSTVVSAWKFDDERIMCEDCYRHRATERKEVQVLLQRAYDTLENKYQITVPKGIKVRFKSAESIRKATKTVIHGGRILGFYSNKNKELWVERGGPAPCVLSTLMHELTHAWQHANLDMGRLSLKFIEGHSTYVEIECTRELGDSVYADFWEQSVEAGTDVYAEGYRYWKRFIAKESDKNIFNHIRNL